MYIIWVEEVLTEETIHNSPIFVLTNTSKKRLETFCF